MESFSHPAYVPEAGIRNHGLACGNCGYTYGQHFGTRCPSNKKPGHVVVECKSSHCECGDKERAHCSAKLTDKATAADPQAFKADGGKPRFDLLMDGAPHALLDVVKVLTWAVEVKHYKPHSWKEVPEAQRRYRAAMQRHENAIARGELNDDESKLPHRAHIACNAIFLAELDYIKE